MKGRRIHASTMLPFPVAVGRILRGFPLTEYGLRLKKIETAKTFSDVQLCSISYQHDAEYAHTSLIKGVRAL
jgi:hypothetical protein